MLSNSLVMESSTAWVNRVNGGPSRVSTARIARLLTEATVAWVVKKLSQRFSVDASGTFRLMTSPTAGTAAVATCELRRTEKRDEKPNGPDFERSVSPDRSNARTLLSMACWGVRARGI